MYEFISRDLKLDLIIALTIINFDDFFLRLIFIPG